MKKCEFCGAELTDEARACGFCGRPVSDAAQPSVAETTEAQSNATEAVDAQQMETVENTAADTAESFTAQPTQADAYTYGQSNEAAGQVEPSVHSWEQGTAQTGAQGSLYQQVEPQLSSEEPKNDYSFGQQNFGGRNNRDFGGQFNQAGQNFGGQYNQAGQNFGGQYNQMGQNYGAQQNYYGTMPGAQPVKRKVNGLALTSFILSLAGIFLNLFFYGIPSALAIVFGIVGLVQCNKKPDTYSCKWAAISGIIIGAVFLVITIILFVLVLQAMQAFMNDPSMMQQIEDMYKQMGLDIDFNYGLWLMR